MKLLRCTFFKVRIDASFHPTSTLEFRGNGESLGKSFELQQDKCKFDESDKKLGKDFASGVEKSQRVAKWHIGAAERWVGWMHADGRTLEMCLAV